MRPVDHPLKARAGQGKDDASAIRYQLAASMRHAFFQCENLTHDRRSSVALKLRHSQTCIGPATRRGYRTEHASARPLSDGFKWVDMAASISVDWGIYYDPTFAFIFDCRCSFDGQPLWLPTFPRVRRRRFSYRRRSSLGPASTSAARSVINGARQTRANMA